MHKVCDHIPFKYNFPSIFSISINGTMNLNHKLQIWTSVIFLSLSFPTSSPSPRPMESMAVQLLNQNAALQQCFEDTISLSLASVVYKKSAVRTTFFGIKLSFPLIAFESFSASLSPKRDLSLFILGVIFFTV